MPLEKDMILTPEKKNILIGEVQLEIDNINKAIRSGQVSSGVLEVVRANRDSLQGVLNKLFAKKGVITPQETSSALDAIDASKRARLQQDFQKGLKKVVVLVTVLLALGVGYSLYKKSKQG